MKILDINELAMAFQVAFATGMKGVSAFVVFIPPPPPFVLPVPFPVNRPKPKFA